MRLRFLIIIVLFYFFAILQNSFFAHFCVLGAGPNLVFILFFTLIFFADPKKHYYIVFYAVCAGLFLDIFLYSYFGVSIILLLLIGFLVKRAQGILSEKKGSFPFVYFFPLFFISLIIYDLLLKQANFNWAFLAQIIYSLLFAGIAFYVCKKLLKFGSENRQLGLFER